MRFHFSFFIDCKLLFALGPNNSFVVVAMENSAVFLVIAKGQLISEQIYAVLNFSKMQRNIARISALAFKMGQIKKVKAHYHPN